MNGLDFVLLHRLRSAPTRKTLSFSTASSTKRTIFFWRSSSAQSSVSVFWSASSSSRSSASGSVDADPGPHPRPSTLLPPTRSNSPTYDTALTSRLRHRTVARCSAAGDRGPAARSRTATTTSTTTAGRSPADKNRLVASA